MACISTAANELTSIGLVAVKKGFLDVGVQFLRAAKSRASVVQQPRLDNMLAAAVKVVRKSVSSAVSIFVV